MEKDQTDIDFDEWWQTHGKAASKQIVRSAHIAGVQSGLDQCKKIIAGDEIVNDDIHGDIGIDE